MMQPFPLTHAHKHTHSLWSASEGWAVLYLWNAVSVLWSGGWASCVLWRHKQHNSRRWGEGGRSMLAVWCICLPAVKHNKSALTSSRVQLYDFCNEMCSLKVAFNIQIQISFMYSLCLNLKRFITVVLYLIGLIIWMHLGDMLTWTKVK